MKSLSGPLQEMLVVLLCYYDEHASTVEDVAESHIFDPIYAAIAAAANEYRGRYGMVPGEHTLDLVEALAARDEKHADQFRDVYSSMEGEKAAVNPQYVLHRLGAFVRRQKMKSGIQNALRLMQSEDDTLDEQAAGLLVKCGDMPDTTFRRGLRLYQDAATIFREIERGDDVFPTGIPDLDRLQLGPKRKTLHLLGALPKRGKSWWLAHLARMCRRSGFKAVIVSLEMSEQLYAKRMVQMVFGATKRPEPVTWRLLSEAKITEDAAWQVLRAESRPNLQDPAWRSWMLAQMAKRARGADILVRDFPTGQLSVEGLVAWLDLMESRDSLVPDLLCVDYVDLMKLPGTGREEMRHRLALLFQALRAIAVERNIAVATVTQVNRGGKSKRRLDEGDLAEDFVGKAGVVDTMLTYNQTDAEHRLGLARLFVALGREDAMRFEVVISQAYQMGQFCISSQRIWDGAYSAALKRTEQKP